MSPLRHTKAQWPISLQELLQRRDHYAKAEMNWCVIHGIIFFGFLIANFVFIRSHQQGGKAPPWVNMVVVGFFIGNLLLLVRTSRKRLRSFDLICPSCLKLLDARIIPLAVATGHCCNCGALLVSNHPSRLESTGESNRRAASA